jgi:hypothetical protein
MDKHLGDHFVRAVVATDWQRIRRWPRSRVHRRRRPALAGVRVRTPEHCLERIGRVLLQARQHVRVSVQHQVDVRVAESLGDDPGGHRPREAAMPRSAAGRTDESAEPERARRRAERRSEPACSRERPPLSEGNTKSLSSQIGPSRRRSSVCSIRCLRSKATMLASSATGRRLPAVFVWPTTFPTPGIRWAWRWMLIVPRSRSTSYQRSALSFPGRLPAISASVKKPCRYVPSSTAAAGNACACATSNVRISLRGTDGVSTPSIGLVASTRHLTAVASATWSTR